MLNRYNVRCNIYVQYLLKDKKGCRRLYNVMVSIKLLQQNTKWEQDVGNINEAEMRLYNSVRTLFKKSKIKGLSI